MKVSSGVPRTLVIWFHWSMWSDPGKNTCRYQALCDQFQGKIPVDMRRIKEGGCVIYNPLL